MTGCLEGASLAFSGLATGALATLFVLRRSDAAQGHEQGQQNAGRRVSKLSKEKRFLSLSRTYANVMQVSQESEGSRQVNKATESKDLMVVTLNFQYFSSYPKDEEKGEKRLKDFLGKDDSCLPDIICVQEGLSSKDVLSPIGYEKIVCSSEWDCAQSVYDMVYGDAPALKLCPPEYHYGYLCNQLYLRKGSDWKMVDRGAIQISSNLQLTGGGGRLEGKLAKRSMVWAKLQSAASGPHVYVMCTHLSGGRFEDQYFMQSLTEERKMQINRIISFYNDRPRPANNDVAILAGDFNATPVYLETGAMHGYFATQIANSPAIMDDARWIWTAKHGAKVEEMFRTYMISPFTAMSEHDWTFAYDRQHVGYTSGFGHTIDHMAMSRPVLVRSAEVLYFTNQKFSKKEPDTDLVLTDHNAVKTVFAVSEPEEMHQFVCRTEADFLLYLKKFKAIVYIAGFGSKQQYADVDAVVEAIAKPLFEDPESLDCHFGKGGWVAVYGGDPLNRDQHDIAVVVNRLQEKYNMSLIAIQADYVEKELGGVDKQIDAVYYYPTEYRMDAGKKSIAWGGFYNGAIVGTTRILLEVNPLSELPLFWIAAGGGDIAAAEFEAAYDDHNAIMHIPAKAKIPQDPAQPYGPCLDLWNSIAATSDWHNFGAGNCVWCRKRPDEDTRKS